jgi:predicted nucleic acid-binding protein
MILVDTNVVSETQNPRGDARVKAHVERRQEDIHISAIVLGEILYGVAKLEAGPRRERLQEFYAGLGLAFGDRILPVAAPVAKTWGRLRAAYWRAGRLLPLADGLIAATALVHDLTLWTRNTRDFEATGVRLFNPWEG